MPVAHPRICVRRPRTLPQVRAVVRSSGETQTPAGPGELRPPQAPTGPPRGRCRRERRGRAVLTPLQRGQLQVLQDELAQEPFHTRLARALQGGVGLSQGKLGSCWAPGQAEEFHKFLDRFPGGNHPQQRRALLCLRDGLTACQTPPSVQETGPASPPPELWSPEPLPRTESSERTRTQQLFLLGEMTNAAGGGVLSTAPDCGPVPPSASPDTRRLRAGCTPAPCLPCSPSCRIARSLRCEPLTEELGQALARQQRIKKPGSETQRTELSQTPVGGRQCGSRKRPHKPPSCSHTNEATACTSQPAGEKSAPDIPRDRGGEGRLPPLFSGKLTPLNTHTMCLK